MLDAVGVFWILEYQVPETLEALLLVSPYR